MEAPKGPHAIPEPPKVALLQKFGPGRALGGTFLAYFGAQFLVAIILGLGIGIYGEVVSKDFNTLANDLSTSTIGQFLTMGLSQLTMLAIVYLFMRVFTVSWKDIGLQRLPKWNDLGYAAIFFIGYFILLAFIMQAVGVVLPQINLEQEQQIGFESAHGFLPLLMVFISLVILPPLVEEILIRGFLYTGLRQKLNQIIAAVVASFCFAIAHLQLGTGAPPLYVAAIDTFFLSLVLIVLRERTNSLWAGIFVHAFKNGVAFLALFIFAVR